MGRSILGLDIRNESVTAVSVEIGIREKRVTACAHVAIDPGKNAEIEWKAALELISREMNLSSSITTVSFPADKIFYRNIRAPFREKKKIRQVLAFNLEPDLPIPVEDLVIDFQPVKIPEQLSSEGLVTASIEKRALASFLDTLESFNIKPRTVTVGGYAAARVFTALGDCPNQLLFADIDTTVCTICFVISGVICFIRTFPITTGTGSQAAAVALHIQRSLFAFHEIGSLNFQPEAVYFTPTSADNIGFQEELSDILNLPVNPVAFYQFIGKIVLPSKDAKWRAEKMDNALALALFEIERLSGLNFFKEGFAEKKYWRENRKKLTATALLTLFVAGLFLFNFSHDLRSRQQMLDQLNLRITEIFRSTFPEVRRIVDPLHQMRLMVKEAHKEATLSSTSNTQHRVVEILNDLSRQIPKSLDVNLSRLDVSPDSVLISGDSDTFNTVDDVKGRLEKVPIFKSVMINSTSKDRSGTRVNFKLKIERAGAWPSD